jgi:hypothetical protein
MHFHFSHDFDIDPAGYWEIFLSEEYTKDLHAQLKMKEFVVLERREEGNRLHRKLKVTPNTAIPSVLQAVIKDTGYTEHDTFDRDKSAMEIRIEPAMLKNKFDFRGTYSVHPAGEGRCRRVFEGDVKVSVMILGGQIEKYMIDQLKSNYEAAYHITKKWIDQKKAAK